MTAINKLHIDFETRSAVDLKKEGTHRYVTHPSTDVLCLAYRFDDGPVHLWRLREEPPLDLIAAINSGVMVTAHNANFEFMVYNFICVDRYKWGKHLQLENLDCTMVRAFSMGLPGKLETAAAALGLKVQKDMKGHRIMMQLSKPRSYDVNGEPVWWEVGDPDIDVQAKYDALYRYCIQDVIVECEVDKRLLSLSKEEKALWQLDQRINMRGVFIDVPAVKRGIKIVEKEKVRLNDLMKQATEGAVATCNSSAALTKWINTFDIYKGELYEVDGPLKSYKVDGKTRRKKQWKKGERKICQGVGKDQVFDMLDMDLPAQVREALLIRQEASKSSTAKLKAMINGISKDYRVRGCFQFYGAASTGRWAGRRLQLQNFTRPTIKQDEIEKVVKLLRSPLSIPDLINNIQLFHGPVTTRVADCLRAMLTCPKGRRFIAADFSAIEARVLAWLAGQESVLGVFRSHGMIYEHEAKGIYKLNSMNDVTSEQRLIGKVATLALGFQGGVGAFQSMAKVYFVKVPDAQADAIKVAWRANNPFIVQYWYDLEKAAMSAVEYPGQKFAAGARGRQVIFLKKGSFLFCRLPSGRAICYPYPKLKMVKTPWDAEKLALTYKGEDNYQFVTKTAYGGLIAENVTQAVARDLLAAAMFRCEARGYNVVMHIHDEVVTENPEDFGSVEELEEILCELPEWATDLPIAAEGWVGTRFRK